MQQDAADLVFEEEKERLAQLIGKLDEEIDRYETQADRKCAEAQDFFILDQEDRDLKQSLRAEATQCRAQAEKLKEMRDEPYFRRIDTVSVGPDQVPVYETLLVGRHDLRIGTDILVLHAWNDRVSRLIDNVQANIGDEEVTVRLRRALEIRKSELQSYHDEYIADENQQIEDGVFDPYLLDILRDNRRRHAPVDIIRSIQASQMDIVRASETQSIIVQGCAGSGKTMILLHRLSYIAYHNPERDWSRTCILSANPSFNEYISNLCQELDIGTIPRTTYEAYVASLIGRYSGHEPSVAKLRSEEHLHPEFLRTVYADKFSKSVRSRAEIWWDEVIGDLVQSGLADVADKRGIEYDQPGTALGIRTMRAWDRLYHAVRSKFSDIGEQLQTAQSDLEKARRLLKNSEDQTPGVQQHVQASKQSVLSFLEVMAPEVQEAFEALRQGSSRIRRESVRGAADIRLKLDNNELIPDDTIRILQHISDAECLMEYNTHVTKLVERTATNAKRAERIDELTRRIANIEAERATDQELEALEKAAEAIGKLTENGLLNGPVAAAVAEARRRSGASGDAYRKTDLYRHNLYLRLLVCNWYYRRPGRTAMETALYIDEAQDYAPTELRLLRLVTGTSTTFDIFGDLRQRTNPGRGIAKWSDLRYITTNVHELSQNYRNTAEIAEYCNAHTGSSVEPIGISGPPVRELSIAEGTSWIVQRHKDDPELRTVIIVPDLTDAVHEQLADAIERGDLHWGTEDDALAQAKSAVPVISVQQSKGREYDAVFAIVDPADVNASYVAYTRAVDELAVHKLRVRNDEQIAEPSGEEPMPAAQAADAETVIAPVEKTQAPEKPVTEDEHETGTRVITGREYHIGEAFSDEFSFAVPNYQRPFSWGREHAGQLLEDLQNAIEDGTDEYFLGSVVVIREDSSTHADIIDGQQRITTLSILAAAMAAKTTGSLRDRTLSMIWQGAGKDRTPRLALRDRDNAYYRSLIDMDSFQHALKIGGSKLTEPQKKLQEIARFFNSALKDMDQERLDQLLTYILEKCSLIVVMTPDYRSAFRIFSVLNDRGLDLQASDILKARVIGALPEDQQDDYTKTWEDMEERIGREAFNRFFDQMLQTMPGTPSKVNASEYILDHVLSGPKAISAQNFVDKLMVPKFGALSTLLTESYAGEEYADKINQSIRWLNLLPNREWVPVAMIWMEKHGTDEKRTADFMFRLERLSSYMAFDKTERAGRLERYHDVAAQLNEGTIPTAIDLSLRETTRFKHHLRSDQYNHRFTRAAKYLMLHLGAAISEREGKTFVLPSSFEIEHVLPLRMPPDSRWARDWTEAQHAQWVNKLANLVPLARKIPPAKKDADFGEKKRRYLVNSNSAGFGIAEDIAAEHQWLPETLRSRMDDLVALLVEHWDLDRVRDRKARRESTPPATNVHKARNR